MRAMRRWSAWPQVSYSFAGPGNSAGRGAVGKASPRKWARRLRHQQLCKRTGTPSGNPTAEVRGCAVAFGVRGRFHVKRARCLMRPCRYSAASPANDRGHISLGRPRLSWYGHRGRHEAAHPLGANHVCIYMCVIDLRTHSFVSSLVRSFVHALNIHSTFIHAPMHA